jgi:hypothetical protein
MNISHEVPLDLLENSLLFNDYDYCLPHLIDKHIKYKEFFIESKKNNRFIIMDNGLFEGIKHTEEDLLSKIDLIKPNIFIVPDEWNNTNFTHRNAKHWMSILQPTIHGETKLMVVLQGKTLSEIISLYKTCVDLGYKHFAFNHSSVAYQTTSHHPNKLVNQMLGRIQLISDMINRNIIHKEHYIHLLGCSLPQEFIYYQWSEYEMIKSVDTSSPIINGLLGITYNDYGLFTKPECKIEEFFEDEIEESILDIMYNVERFREFIK